MKTFSYHAARAQCRHAVDSRTSYVGYFGPMCARAFSELAPQVLLETSRSDAALIRMDRCLWLSGATPVVQMRAGHMPPACVVVRPDQYDFWVRYAAIAADAGFRRVVFLDSQLALAQEWLLRQATRRRALLLS